MLRIKAPDVHWAQWVWNKAIPKRVSVAMWKALSGSLSVDSSIRKVGIAIASKCNCCLVGHDKNTDHVLSTGDFADEVWKKLSHYLGLQWRSKQGWWERVQLWCARAKRSTQLGCLLGMLPCLITWRLWVRRCRARMEGKNETVQEVVTSIKFWLQQMAYSIKKVRALSSHDARILSDLDIPCVMPRQRQTRMITWRRPRAGRVKLNVDGCSFGNPNPSGRGGVIRDEFGKVRGGY
ncbi:unnamed protein product [Fraxinus pennsylvanica]|uniref:Reverse transcriptase zinc-binding domain-containing protein n=1 Tax=Fraxinus pennsylvanica TaxID=56036 RepID=A0AAD1ZUQ1_9LAMI|nr:unnamed protein product [Fraxinus pennsylvanica]